MTAQNSQRIPRQFQEFARAFYQSHNLPKPDRQAMRALREYLDLREDEPNGFGDIMYRTVRTNRGMHVMPDMVWKHSTWSGYTDQDGKPLYLPVLGEVAMRQIVYDAGIYLLNRSGSRAECPTCNSACDIQDRYGLPRLDCSKCNGTAEFEKVNRQLGEKAARRVLIQRFLFVLQRERLDVNRLNQTNGGDAHQTADEWVEAQRAAWDRREHWKWVRENESAEDREMDGKAARENQGGPS